MKLYKISQDLNNDYDTYDSAIVAANSIDDARTIHPENEPQWGKQTKEEYVRRGYYPGDREWIPFSDIDKINVEYIGTAAKGTKRGVILSSYNSG